MMAKHGQPVTTSPTSGRNKSAVLDQHFKKAGLFLLKQTSFLFYKFDAGKLLNNPFKIIGKS